MLHKNGLKLVLLSLLTIFTSSLEATSIEDYLVAGEPSEAVSMAKVVIRSTFRIDGERCYAAVKSFDGKATHLREYAKPHLSFRKIQVGETEKLNGVTETYTLNFTYDHKREWNRKWSEWDGGDRMAGSTWTFQKKNGGWSTYFNPFLNQLVQDEAERDAQIAEANGISGVISPKTAERIFAGLHLKGLFSGARGPAAAINNEMISVGGITYVRIDGENYKIQCLAIEGGQATFQISGTTFTRSFRL
jgi:hypothetical protein